MANITHDVADSYRSVAYFTKKLTIAKRRLAIGKNKGLQWKLSRYIKLGDVIRNDKYRGHVISLNKKMMKFRESHYYPQYTFEIVTLAKGKVVKIISYNKTLVETKF